MKAIYPKTILTLISFLKKLPGIGTKTAERFAFELIKWDDEDLSSFGNLISNVKKKLKKCTECGCLTESYCIFCKRESSVLCIISSAKDVYAIEDINAYFGHYQVFPLISPMQGNYEDEKNIESLFKRIEDKNITEVIIALDSTLEGDATSLYIKSMLNDKKVSISRIAFGLPIGSSLEYIDGGTLAKSFSGRQNF